MKKNTAILTLLLTVLAAVGLIYGAAVGFGETQTGAAKNIKLGLDLAGGVSITYQTVIDNPTQEQMDDTVYKLQKRVEGYSTEAVVYLSSASSPAVSSQTGPSSALSGHLPQLALDDLKNDEITEKRQK